MKSIKKPVFFIIAVSILIFSVLNVIGISTYYGDNRTVYIKGVQDIRWGIDIRGGVDVTFTPDVSYGERVTNEEIDAAESIITTRMISKNITDYEVYKDYNTQRIIVRFPWQSGDTSFDPKAAVDELGETALLTFYEGETQDGMPVLTGADVKRAVPDYQPGAGTARGQFVVALELHDSEPNNGASKFSAATAKLAPEEGIISIWMDDIKISAPRVNDHIATGRASITGGGEGFTQEEATELANKINGGALPFKLEVDSFSTISPTLGEGARNAMAIAGAISFVIMCIFMISRYKILGVISSFGLAGQLFGALAVISGFVGVFDSFTLTIPGIAGIILSIGMGIDANVITFERIKEEIRSGKTLDGAVQSGYKRAFSAIFDGNITMIIVAFILMGAFGTPDSFASTILYPIFFMFGPSAAGAIYSFGYTLIIGVILNFIFGVFLSRLMTYSLVKFKVLRKLTLYGGYKNDSHKEKVENKKVFNAVANKKKFLGIPIVVIAVAIALTFVIGLEVAIEFKGGSVLTYPYTGEIDTNAIRTAVADTGKSTVKVTTGSSLDADFNTVTISFTSNENITTKELDELETMLVTTFENISNDVRETERQSVSPTMGHRFFLKCLVAVIFSFIVLMIYIALRFKAISGWSAGFFSILALLIEVSMVYAVFVFFRFSIDANFIAVVLTILCYSVNDTIVVFDRIRENRTLHGKKLGYSELVNKSVAQSMTRSLSTTASTCMAMLVICIVAFITGLNSMFAFAFPLLLIFAFGIITSLFIVGPLWATWQNRKLKVKETE